MPRFTDDFRRRVILEIRDRARVVWDPTEPQFRSCGARTVAFIGVAYRLHSADIVLDVRRMWRRWVKVYYAYKIRRTLRRPKFHNELSFLDGIGVGQLNVVASMF